MGLFSKLKRGANRFFKKVAGGVSDTFKKGGYLTKGLDYANKGLAFGSKIIGAIEKVPILGQALSPLTTIARTGLGLGNKLLGGVRAGQNIAIDTVGSLRRGENVDNKLMDHIKSGYAGGKDMYKEGKGVNFKGAGKEVKGNILERVKEVKTGDSGLTFA
jgi:hypothetical protein